MSINTKVKNFLRHALNENWARKLCRTCLLPLDKDCENVFSKIIEDDKKVSIADVLRTIYDLKISEEDNCNVCSCCLQKAIAAYDFYRQIDTTEKIFNYCISKFSNFLNVNIDTDVEENNGIFFYLSINKIIGPNKSVQTDTDLKINEDKGGKIEIIIERDPLDSIEIKPEIESNIDMYVEKGANDNNLIMNDNDEVNNKPCQIDRNKRKQGSITIHYKYCTRCPTRYKFYANLKQHMKSAHCVDLFVCKICDALVEGAKEFDTHKKTHTNVYICDCCKKVFKNRDIITSHLKHHVEFVEMTGDSNICDICGKIFTDIKLFKIHNQKFHETKVICLYCGKKVKRGKCFDDHVKKHTPGPARKTDKSKYSCEFCDEPFSLWEQLHKHIGNKHGDERYYKCDICNKRFRTIQTLAGHKRTHTKEKGAKTKYHCEVCGGSFVNAHTLQAHQSLHTGEKPYACEICDKRFITANRRNLHVTCAHTAPTLQCPLCASLFHLRANVNSHIKKVHLKPHKKWNRALRHQSVGWKTEQVPLEELSLDIQKRLKECQNNIDGI